MLQTIEYPFLKNNAESGDLKQRRIVAPEKARCGIFTYQARSLMNSWWTLESITQQRNPEIASKPFMCPLKTQVGHTKQAKTRDLKHVIEGFRLLQPTDWSLSKSIHQQQSIHFFSLNMAQNDQRLSIRWQLI